MHKTSHIHHTGDNIQCCTGECLFEAPSCPLKDPASHILINNLIYLYLGGLSGAVFLLTIVLSWLNLLPYYCHYMMLLVLTIYTDTSQ